MTRAAAVLALLLALVGPGCGERRETLGPGTTEKLTLLLDFFPNADHAGIYAAEAGGHFEELGLDVEIRQPADPAAPIKQVAAGKVDLAISYEPEVLLARDKGIRVVSVAAVVQKPLTSIVSLPGGGVETPADLAGKRVGTAGIPYQGAYLRAVAEEAGIDPDDVEERNIGFNFSQALISKRVDAVLGAFWNYEGTDLALRGRKPRIIRIEAAGVPTYNELVLVANEDALDRNESRIRRFIAALGRGTRDLRREPRTAIDALLEANDELDPKLQRAVVRVTLPLFFPPRGRPYGFQNPAEWRAYGRWMRANRLVEGVRPADGAFTNRLLPGSGP